MAFATAETLRSFVPMRDVLEGRSERSGWCWMIKKDVAGATSARTRATEKTRPNLVASPEEGARLIRAFVGVRNPRVRKAIIAFVENLSA
jgi:hypothetical protein